LKNSLGGETSIVFNHGLVGNWDWTDQTAPDNSLIKFETTDGKSLRFLDVQRLGSWHVGTWGPDRGPDPLEDYDRFRDNVLQNVHSKAFDKPIAEVLLNQDYFNGIGNYLRAEILHRACIPPMLSASEVFTSNASNLTFMHQGKSARKSDLLLALCKAIPKEVLDQDLNKYGSPSEKARFHDWLRVYDKGQFIKDKGGRKVWFVHNQPANEPTEQDKHYINQSSVASSATFAAQALSTAPSFGFSGPAPVASFFSPLAQQSAVAFSLGSSASTSAQSTLQQGLASHPTSQLTQELVLVGLLFKGGKIDAEQRKVLKMIAFDHSGKYHKLKDTLAATLECFQADRDFDNAADTLHRVCGLLYGSM